MSCVIPASNTLTRRATKKDSKLPLPRSAQRRPIAENNSPIGPYLSRSLILTCDRQALEGRQQVAIQDTLGQWLRDIVIPYNPARGISKCL